MNENVINLDVYRATAEAVPISETTEYQRLVAANLATDDTESQFDPSLPADENTAATLRALFERANSSGQ